MLIASQLLLTAVQSQNAAVNNVDHGLVPPVLNHNPLPHYDYDKLDYGMNMGLEQTLSGRIWSCWTAGGDDPNSFLILMHSDDDGITWSKPALVVDAQDPDMKEKRAVQNGTLWRDPLGRMWLFFDQSVNDFDGRAGVWFSVCSNPDDKKPVWSAPKRLWHGTAKSKPIVLSNGAWLLPVSLLNRGIIDKNPPTYLNAYTELDSLRMAHVFISYDQGESWQRQGGVRFPDASYDEHHVVERNNHDLWMTARTNNGIWESVSKDQGKTWSKPAQLLPHISSRHFIRRLKSGNILLVKHGELNERTKTRSKLMAFLSGDDGRTWQGGLMLDERRGISYPDGFQSAEGMIYISYDHNRATDGHIMMAKFSEEDVFNKNFGSKNARSKQLIAEPKGLDKLTPPSHLLKMDREKSARILNIPSVVASVRGDKIMKVKKGAKVYTDKEYLFGSIPSWLAGMEYIQTSFGATNDLHPITEGFVYGMAPVGSEEEVQLKTQGFNETDYPAFGLIGNLNKEFAVYRKDVTYEKFRTGHIQGSGLTIFFFRNRDLSAHTLPANFTWMPGPEYGREDRLWQGCPSIEITGKRTWATWFSGGEREPDRGNYGIISYTEDGRQWKDPAMVIYHKDSAVRVMDTELWKDPLGRLWIFWTQNEGAKGFDGSWSTWAIYTTNPEANNPSWTKPKLICNGLTRNKPVVLSTGEWLLPSYDWVTHQSKVYASVDKGKTWKYRGGITNQPDDNFYEHMVVELKNGDLWMLQRNIQSSISKDKGKTWSTPDTLHQFNAANSRLFISRLQSGRLLLIYNNDENKRRKNLTAFLSDDDGKTWPYSLVIDERDNVSYPEAIQHPDGLIQVIYDRSRTGAKEILIATFTEQDIISGKFKSPSSEEKIVISKGGTSSSSQ